MVLFYDKSTAKEIFINCKIQREEKCVRETESKNLDISREWFDPDVKIQSVNNNNIKKQQKTDITEKKVLYTCHLYETICINVYEWVREECCFFQICKTKKIKNAMKNEDYVYYIYYLARYIARELKLVQNHFQQTQLTSSGYTVV